MDALMLDKNVTDRVTKEKIYAVETVEDSIHIAFFTAIDNIIIPRVELAVKPTNASSEQVIASVTGNSEIGGQAGIYAFMGTYPMGKVNSANRIELIRLVCLALAR